MFQYHNACSIFSVLTLLENFVMDGIEHAVQSVLFVTTAFPYGAIWFLVWGIALLYYLFRRRSFSGKVAKITFWIFFLCFPLLLALINVPKFPAEYEFRKACAEDSGLFVYKKVSLGPEYWLAIDPKTGPSSDGTSYTSNPGIELNQLVFDRDFKIESEFQRMDTDIIEMSTTLTDSRSGEILSEFKDFSAQLSFFMSQTHRTCGTLGFRDAPYSSASYRRHDLMKRTFNSSE
jgi:hypothetical protein